MQAWEVFCFFLGVFLNNKFKDLPVDRKAFKAVISFKNSIRRIEFTNKKKFEVNRLHK